MWQITSASLSANGLQLLISTRFSPTRTIDLRTDKALTKFIDKEKRAGSTVSFYTSTFCCNDTVRLDIAEQARMEER
jgi:hypothetical protein